jgi:carbon monoxide dehydrogenase subunit G
MNADRHAPVFSEGSILIEASPEHVWDVLADVEKWPDWNPAIDSVKVEGPVAPGTVFRWKAGSTRLVSTMQDVDRPGRLSWTGRAMGIDAFHEWRFASSGEGTTVTMHESFSGLVARLLKGKLQRDLDRTTEKALAALKAAAEAEE